MRRGLLLTGLLLLTSAAPAPAAPPAPPGRHIEFLFGLVRPEAAARAAFWAVSTPGSPRYRRFLRVPTVSGRYGATRATRSAFRRALRAHGLTGSVDASGVFGRARGTVATFERVFHVDIRGSFDNDTNAAVFFPARGTRPRLPGNLRRVVREVVTSYDVTSTAPPGQQGGSAVAARHRPPEPRNRGTWTDGCRAARVTGAYSFAQVRHAYGVDALARAGANVAIMNVGEGLTAGAIRQTGRCFGLRTPRVTTLRADGQARPFGLGSFEPSEDLELVRGTEPRLRSLVLTQTWDSPDLWFLAPANVLHARPLPDVLSISYGQCEATVRGRRAGSSFRAGANLMDSVLLRLGLAGVGTFASAGDFGSTCNGGRFQGVAWPASSPYVTSVGGTRLILGRANRRRDEVVWNDLRWLVPGNGGGAGGGGVAAFSPRPPYQRGLPVRTSRRSVPDVAAHASLLPGWPVVLGGNWVQDSGTSASAPLVAGAFARISAGERAAGRPPLGPADGLLYAAAPQAFFDVVHGGNRYLSSVHGRPARPGYDLASGLGVPRFAVLARFAEAAGGRR